MSRESKLINDKNYGFTLIEMLVTISLLSTLLLVALPLRELGQIKSKEEQLKKNLLEIRCAIDKYHAAVIEGKIDRATSQSGYPPNLKSLVEGVVDQENPNGNKIYFLRRIPIDPMCADCDKSRPDESWDLRSYESSYEDFEEGADVYDIRSKSPKKGIDGIPYKFW